MNRFSTTISRSRDDEESVARYQLQTDSGPAVTAVFSTASRPRAEESARRRYELQTDNQLFRPEDGEDGAELSPLTGAGPGERKEPK